ncbi:MAG: SPOR domain-containing protein [Alteraurantiacibacter sp.]|nr:SPOR domain-containing protein [Alteraurantiacibacter sp.]
MLAPAGNGPSADYPVVIGDPFVIDGVTHTPSDQLNYDAVGYAAIGRMAGMAVTAAHKTLPLPSYVEVTSLESGRTILVRVERRGPMRNDLLIELSPGAAAQLGLADGERAPVRVRRVNPPEPDRALLRAGKQAPERMATPEALLKVLSRRLAENRPLAALASPADSENGNSAETQEEDQGRSPVRAGVASGGSGEPAIVLLPNNRPVPSPSTSQMRPAPPTSGDLVVQVAAFSSKERADAVAQTLGASVSKPGNYWTVRLGPYSSHAAANEGLAKARAAGYSDAWIQRNN